MTIPRATAGMSGDGVYNRHSSLQRAIVERAEHRLVEAVRRIGAVKPEFTVVDYGCGPGRNSVIAFRAVIGEYRKHSADGPIVAIHNDQIGNDWNDLFANVSGADGYLSGNTAIRSQASACSFYESVAAPASVSLGMSFTALQWLHAAVELPSPNTLYFADLEDPARRELARLAARDWAQFLRKRALELRPNGRLLVQCLGAVADPHAPGGIEPGVRGLFRLLWEVASDLADDGHVDRGVLDKFVMPQWFRTVEEARAPIEQEADLSRAFAIEELSIESVALPFAQAYRRNGDADGYAAGYAAFVRGFSESTFRDLVFAPSSGDARATAELTEEFFARLEARFRARPGEHDYAVRSLVVLLRRN